MFAPVGAAKGLTKVFDTGRGAEPRVRRAQRQAAGAIVDKVAAAVIGYGGGGAIAGWAEPSREPYVASRAGSAR